MTREASIHFEAVLFLLKDSVILRLPEAASAKLPSRGQVAVRGTLNGHELRTVLEPDGDRGHWIRVDAAQQKVAGIGPGDEVITTPITWVATANVIVTVGARPVFVDVDPHTRNMDLAAAAAAITPRTRALMPVYLAGLPMSMDALYALARANDLRVIEDAAQAIDSRWQGRRIGSFGDLVSFSFQANKNITCAEGGCLVVNSAAEAELVELLRLQGVVRRGADGMDVENPGGKSSLTDINATIVIHQFRLMDEINRPRAERAHRAFDAP